MKVNPVVSVIVAACNVAAHAGECLACLCAQTWPAEVIVVDDGSVDGTRGRARDFSMTLLAERGAGSPYAARNTDIARARGEILAFSGSDCVPVEDWVAQGLGRVRAWLGGGR